MKKTKETLNEKQIHLPTYKEIPNVGLYLDQTSKYINEALSEVPDCVITNSMISNYVKKKLIANPIKKQYGRDQIASLIFIALTKSALSLEDVANIFRLRKESYSTEEAYTYFSKRFEAVMNDNEAPKKIEDDLLKGLLEKIISTIVSNIRLHDLLAKSFSNEIKK